MKRFDSSVPSGESPDFTCACAVGPHRVRVAALASTARYMWTVRPHRAAHHAMSGMHATVPTVSQTARAGSATVVLPG